MATSLKIKVIREECIGDGACCAEAPNTFVLDDDSIAVVVPDVTDSDDVVLTAAKACPTNAIVVCDKAGKQLVP